MLVANVEVMTIVDTNFALNKATVTFNVIVTLFKVSKAAYVNEAFALNSHPRCARGNRVLVANVEVMTIVDTNFALNKVTVTFNVIVTLFKVSEAAYVNEAFAL